MELTKSSCMNLNLGHKELGIYKLDMQTKSGGLVKG